MHVHVRQAWLNGEGLTLPVDIKYDTSLAKDAYDLAARWEKSREVNDPLRLDFERTDLDKFNSNQKGARLR